MTDIKEHGNIRLPSTRGFELGLEAEDPSNFLSKLIDSLIRFLKRFAADLFDGSAGMSMTLGRIHHRAEQINTESRARGRTNRGETFNIETRIKNLCINYKAISDPQQLLLLTKSTDPLFKAYFRYQNHELPAVIPSLVTVDPRDPESVIKVVELLSPISPIAKAAAMGMQGDNAGRSSVPLLGNQRLHATSKHSVGDAVEQLSGQEWLLTAVNDNPKPLPRSIEFSVFASTIEQSMLRQVIATVSDIEANFSIMSRNRRGIRIDDLLRYLERIRNAINTGQYDAESMTRANQIVNMLNAYNHWLVSPYLDLMSLYIGNSTALLNVCDANN